MTWTGRTVFVTGAGGFIGSHLCEQLVHAGAVVRAFVRYNSRNDIGMLKYLAPALLSHIHIVFGDLRDGDAVRNAMHGCEVAFHLGALIGIPYSYQHPREVIDVNVLGTLNALEAARATGVSRFVHTSSSEVFGTAQAELIDEAHPLHGQSPYAASKIGADKIVQSYFLSFDVPVVTIRPFNTFGPRQSQRAVIPTIVAQALAQGVIHLGSLDPIRDFTFVTDTVWGMMLAASTPGIEGEEFNLGTNEEVSIGELVRRIARIMKRELNVETREERIRPEKSEVKRLRSNNTKARDRLGWQPRVSLDTGLRDVIEWMSQYPELYRNQRYTV